MSECYYIAMYYFDKHQRINDNIPLKIGTYVRICSQEEARDVFGVTRVSCGVHATLAFVVCRVAFKIPLLVDPTQANLVLGEKPERTEVANEGRTG